VQKTKYRINIAGIEAAARESNSSTSKNHIVPDCCYWDVLYYMGDTLLVHSSFIQTVETLFKSIKIENDSIFFLIIKVRN